MKSVRDMLALYNTQVEQDARYEVVRYLLSHACELDELALSEVARNTFVSKSTVSRLVRHFGYDNYEEFLAETHRYVSHDPAINLRMTTGDLELIREDVQGYLASYVDGICRALQQLKEAVDAETIDWLIHEMSVRETALFATEQPLMIARDVQASFLVKGKLLQLGETKRKRAQIARDLPASSLAVVLSNYGRYVEGNRTMLEDMRQRGVSLCLVTLCYEGPGTLLFDRVVRLSNGGFSSAGSYPMKAFFEVLCRRLLVCDESLSG